LHIFRSSLTRYNIKLPSETPTSEFRASVRLLLWSQKATECGIGAMLNDVNISTRFCGSRSSVEKEDKIRWLDDPLRNSFSYGNHHHALCMCVLPPLQLWSQLITFTLFGTDVILLMPIRRLYFSIFNN
jgi:hypothetical protein